MADDQDLGLWLMDYTRESVRSFAMVQVGCIIRESVLSTVPPYAGMM